MSKLRCFKAYDIGDKLGEDMNSAFPELKSLLKRLSDVRYVS